MNSKDYRNIREAYLQVYAPQELTEEQVWEEVEYWVNSLLEEGYDLSDYTWEEMYETYLEEGPYSVDSVKAAQQAAQAGQVKRDAAAVALKKQTRAQDVAGFKKAMLPPPKSNTMDGRYAAPGTQKIIPKAVVKPVKSDLVTPVKPAISTPAISTPAASRPAATPATPAASRPAATPAASTGPKSTPTPTTPTKPAIGTTPGGTKFERRTPTSAELSAAQASRASGGSEEDAIKAGVGASKPTPPPTPAAAPTPTPAPTPSGESDRLKKALDIKKSDVTSGFDMFDVVKGYLIGEGYADTEEAALVIMANMSEDWKYSIVVEGYKEIDSAKHQRMYARYKNLRTAAMKDARETGEASGDNRFKMSKMNPVIDKSAENLRKKR